MGDRTQRTITKNGATTQEDFAYQTGSHRLQSVTTTDASGTRQRSFQHDANGNTIADISPERALALAFNARNRLAEIDKDGSPVGMYQYNALGQRVAKTSSYVGRTHATLDQGNTAAANNGKANGKGNANANSQSNLHVTTDTTLVTEHLQFVYDAQGNLIAENDDQGNVIREYIYLDNIRIAMTNASLDHPQVTPSQGPVGPLVLYFIHSDHLGTPRDVTGANQNIIWAMHQTPFGKATLDTEAIRMPMRFPGQYADIESGLNYNYFRDYDPTLGRYVESDPVGLSGGMNEFRYASNMPTQSSDRTGLLNFLATLGGSFIQGLGFEGYVGVYVTLPSPGTNFDIGILGSGGVGMGYNKSFGNQYGFIKGNEQDINGISYNLNAEVNPVGGTLMFDQTGQLIGFMAGPTEGYGASLTYVRTRAVGLNDLGRWLGHWLASYIYPSEVSNCPSSSQ